MEPSNRRFIQIFLASCFLSNFTFRGFLFFIFNLLHWLHLQNKPVVSVCVHKTHTDFLLNWESWVNYHFQNSIYHSMNRWNDTWVQTLCTKLVSGIYKEVWNVQVVRAAELFCVATPASIIVRNCVHWHFIHREGSGVAAPADCDSFILVFYWNPAEKWRSHCALSNASSWNGKRLLGPLSYVQDALWLW